MPVPAITFPDGRPATQFGCLEIVAVTCVAGSREQHSMSETSLTYESGELALFEHAKNWKSYFGAVLKPYISGDVAEVGAGIGGTTAALWNPAVQSWLCIEPDPDQAKQIEAKIKAGALPANCRARPGVLSDNSSTLFDTILYIDVVEHIADDRGELRQAFSRLRPGGNLVVLVPAFQALYSDFDRHVGHHRRYAKSELLAIAPEGAKLVRAQYLDSLAAGLSLANKLVLGAKLPTLSQILFWDRVIVPVSRVTDVVLSPWVGKSAIAIWARP